MILNCMQPLENGTVVLGCAENGCVIEMHEGCCNELLASNMSACCPCCRHPISIVLPASAVWKRRFDLAKHDLEYARNDNRNLRSQLNSALSQAQALTLSLAGESDS